MMLQCTPTVVIGCEQIKVAVGGSDPVNAFWASVAAEKIPGESDKKTGHPSFRGLQAHTGLLHYCSCLVQWYKQEWLA